MATYSINQTRSAFSSTVDYFDDIKSAIEEKGVSTTGLTLAELPSAINSIPSGGSVIYDSRINPILERTISSFEYSGVTIDKTYLFWHNSSITTIGLPAASRIPGYLATSAFNLSYAYAPAATEIGTYAFRSCISLYSIYAPNVTTISSYAFFECGISSAMFSLCTSIGQSAFKGCYNLSYISLPEVTYIDASAFAICGSYANDLTAYLPKLETVSAGAFISVKLNNLTDNIDDYNTGDMYASALIGCDGLGAFRYATVKSVSLSNYTGGDNITRTFCECYQLVNVSLPKLSYVGASMFYNCTQLANCYEFTEASRVNTNGFRSCAISVVSLPKCTFISGYAFYGCRSLESLYLLSPTFCSLYNANAFTNTPMRNSTYLGHYGSIYVPASLVDSYKTATDWYSLRSRFVGV